jgi:hypothetical protein
MKPGQLVRIRDGWMDEGKVGIVIGESPFLDGAYYWTPVLFVDEDDPNFIKTRGLELFEPMGAFTILRKRFKNICKKS